LQDASIGAVFAAAAASYFVSLFVLLPVRVERDGRTSPLVSSEGLFDSALAGLRVVAADRESGTVLTLYGAQNFVAGALNVLIVVTALHLLGLGQSSVGALTAAIGVGGVVGGGLVLARVRRERHGSDLALGLVLWGVPLVALALAKSETAAFLLLVVVGIGVTVVDVSAVTLLQRAAQGELLAHALGLLQAIFVATLAFHGSGLSAIEEKKAAGEDPTHGSTAAVRRAETNITRKQQAREWDEQHGKLVDLSAFQRDILPIIQGVSLSQLQRTTGLSLRYVSLIRRGERTPHPRHWQGFIEAAETR